MKKVLFKKNSLLIVFVCSIFIALSTGFSAYIITKSNKVTISVNSNNITVKDGIFINYDYSDTNKFDFDITTYGNKNYYVDDNCSVKISFDYAKYISSGDLGIDCGIYILFEFGENDLSFLNHVKSIICNNFFSLKYQSIITGAESTITLKDSSLYSYFNSNEINTVEKPYTFNDSENSLVIHVPFAVEHSPSKDFYLCNLSLKDMPNKWDIYLNFDFQFVDPNYGYLTFLDTFNSNDINVTLGIERYL